MLSMILFITNLIIKFYNAFAIHKTIGKQASITKILLTGIFGIFSQTLTQLVAQIMKIDMKMDLYLGKIYSRVSFQAIEFY